eukprot:6465130-Amphidinium_carterae.1
MRALQQDPPQTHLKDGALGRHVLTVLSSSGQSGTCAPCLLAYRCAEVMSTDIVCLGSLLDFRGYLPRDVGVHVVCAP